MASNAQRSPRWFSFTSANRVASKGIASSFLAVSSSLSSSTKRNWACGSMKRRMSQGQATRSTLTLLRVIHFMLGLSLGNCLSIQLFGHGLPLIALCQGDLGDRLTILECRKDAHRTKSRIALQSFCESGVKRLLRLCHRLVLCSCRRKVFTTRDDFGLGGLSCFVVDNDLRKITALGRVDRQLQLTVFDLKFRRNGFAFARAGGQALIEGHVRLGHCLREFSALLVLGPQARIDDQPDHQQPDNHCCSFHDILLRVFVYNTAFGAYLAVTR